MRLLMDVLSATTRLDVAAEQITDPEQLKDQMRRVSADLKVSAERSSSTWGLLTRMVKALEKGERVEM